MFENIAKYYLENIVTGEKFFSSKPVTDALLLYPEFAELMASLVNELKVYKVELRLLETYRSNKLQQYYYEIGASKIKNNGMHHFGIAVDTILIDDDGRTTYKGNWKLIHQIFEELGGTDLGNLENWDAAHFQFIPVIEQTQLRAEIDHYIKMFQKANNLVIDGIVGNKTRNKAIELFK